MNFSALTSVLLVLSSCLVGHLYGQIDDSLWEHWKSKFGKQYGLGDEPRRRQIWEQTVREVAEHNLKYDLGLVTYTMGLNQFSDMEWEELKSKYLMNDLDKHLDELRANVSTQSIDDDSAIPDQVDWRGKLVTPVKNQGSCGSCWSFATVAVVEGQYKKTKGELVSFSEQELVDCAGKFGNHGCNGGWPPNAMKYIIKNGLSTGKEYPYTGREGSCRMSQTNRAVKGLKWASIPRADEQKMIAGIAEVGPISVAIEVVQDLFRYKSGVYITSSCRGRVNHAVTAVGYGKANDGQAFYIIKNSWGTGWGEGGYCRFARNRNNMCQVASYGSFMLVK